MAIRVLPSSRTVRRGNDDLFFSGTPGTVYNPGAGLGISDFTQLGAAFASQR